MSGSCLFGEGRLSRECNLRGNELYCTELYTITKGLLHLFLNLQCLGPSSHREREADLT